MTAPLLFRTRLAPTPSGYLHLGNIFSFAITAQLAQQRNAGVLLRIDDLDRERTQPEYVQDIFDTLRFLDINWTEGPANPADFETTYSQFHRLTLYNEVLLQLQAGGHLFACTCSRSSILQQRADGSYPGTCRDKHIPLSAPGVAWRLRTDNTKSIEVQTVENGIIGATLPPDVQDFIVRKKDGFPSYQLASVADDLHFGVNLVVRGEDLWSSTLAQLYLSQCLPDTTFGATYFHHHSLLSGADGSKLSKSAGATSIQYLRRQGLSPAAIWQLINDLS